MTTGWNDYFDLIPTNLKPFLGEDPFYFLTQWEPLLKHFGSADVFPVTSKPQFGATIAGQNVLMNDDIREHCRVGGNVIAYPGAVLGRCGEISDSIFLPRARAPHFAFVAQSILGYDCNLGAGTITANAAFDKRLKKKGAIIGDRVRIGVNVSIMPQTLIGKDSVIYPGIRIKGAIKPGSVVMESNF